MRTLRALAVISRRRACCLDGLRRRRRATTTTDHHDRSHRPQPTTTATGDTVRHRDAGRRRRLPSPPPRPTVRRRRAAGRTGPVQIDVVVGIDSGARPHRDGDGRQRRHAEHHQPGRRRRVPRARLSTSSRQVAEGETATFNFVADQAGTFEVESHVTDDVLLVIEVV